MTSPRDQLSKRGEQVQQHRHRDVVGQVGDHGGRRLRQRVDPERVGVDHRERRSHAPGVAQPPYAAAECQQLIDLHRDHPVGTCEQAEGQRAEAGTDLEHDVVSATPEAATIRRTVLASVTKFWPRCLLGRRSSRLASSRTAVGSSRPPATC